jgi:hypothetical protein
MVTGRADLIDFDPVIATVAGLAAYPVLVFAREIAGFTAETQRALRRGKVETSRRAFPPLRSLRLRGE